jgi:all-trans-nonaprenyl-diphosphate synthase
MLLFECYFSSAVWQRLGGTVCFIATCCCLQVIKLISQVIADFANGEISQATALFDTEVSVEQYLEKSFFKTASLIAASCRSAAVFSDCDEATKEAMYTYGRHLGLAFQVLASFVKLCLLSV